MRLGLLLSLLLSVLIAAMFSGCAVRVDWYGKTLADDHDRRISPAIAQVRK